MYQQEQRQRRPPAPDQVGDGREIRRLCQVVVLICRVSPSPTAAPLPATRETTFHTPEGVMNRFIRAVQADGNSPQAARPGAVQGGMGQQGSSARTQERDQSFPAGGGNELIQVGPLEWMASGEDHQGLAESLHLVQ